MTKTDAENVIDAVCGLSSAATEIFDSDDISPEKAFSGIKHFLGNYYGAPVSRDIVLDRTTIGYCRSHIKTAGDGYYTAIEFFDIDLDPIQELAEYLEDQDHGGEAELIWAVVDFVKEIRQWAGLKSAPAVEHPYTPHRRQEEDAGHLSEEAFLALFAADANSHKARILLEHIIEVSKEKSVHTYYGALVTQCKSWFKVNEQDFASLLRNFLSAAGLDPSLAANVRETKLGAKVVKRAQEKFNEINRSRAHR